MASKRQKNLKSYVFPLNMNGLQGRMLKVPSEAKSREILFVYGHHATLERWFGLAHELLRYGGVTIPDLPGFGGMSPLYRIGEKPSLDIYADYLASFVKLRYKQRRLTIVAEGFGFLVATRMLQRYSSIARKVDLIVGLTGFAHYEDLKVGNHIMPKRLITRIFGWRLTAWVLKRTYFRPKTIKQAYRSQSTSQRRRHLEATVFTAQPSEQPGLWQRCDLATHFMTIKAMLSVDNCTIQVNVPACLVSTPGNPYINKHLAEQHLQIAFADCEFLEAKIGRRKLFGNDAKTAATLLPHRLRARLKRTKRD